MPGMKLYVLDLGHMMMDKNFWLEHSVVADRLVPNRSNEYIEFPVSGYLIRHPQGNILFDLGCHPQAMGPDGHWPQGIQTLFPYLNDPKRDTLLPRLAQLGLTPADIDWVILSHLHLDHAGGVEFFPDSQLMVHENEFHACLAAYATQNRGGAYIWDDTDAWIRRPLHWNLVTDRDGDLSLLPGITVLNLGAGHTPGMLGLHVQLEQAGDILLVSDAVYAQASLGPPLRLPGFVHDTVGWRTAANRLQRLARQAKAQMWFGHDMDQFNGLIKSDRGFYD